MKSEERVGYVRLQAAQIKKENSQPTWHTLTSVADSRNQAGLLLMNCQLVSMPTGQSNMPKRKLTKRGIQKQF